MDSQQGMILELAEKGHHVHVRNQGMTSGLAEKLSPVQLCNQGMTSVVPHELTSPRALAPADLLSSIYEMTSEVSPCPTLAFETGMTQKIVCDCRNYY